MEKSILLLPYNSRLTFNVTLNELDDKDKYGVQQILEIFKLLTLFLNGLRIRK